VAACDPAGRAALETRSPGAVPPPVDGTAAVGPVGARSGLLGLAERLRLCDGTLDAGRQLGGGFQVRARIPLEPT